MLIKCLVSLCYFVIPICAIANDSLQQKINCLEKRIKKNNQNIQQAEIVFARRQADLKYIQYLDASRRPCYVFPRVIQDKKTPSIFDTIDRRLALLDYNPFRFESFNGRAYINLHGWLEFDDDFFFNASGLTINDGVKSIPINHQNTAIRFWINRARPIVEGGFGKYIHFLFDPDFSQSQKRLYDAHLDFYYYRLAGVRIGKQPSLVSNIQSYTYAQIAQILQPGFTTILGPNRETGFVLFGSVGPYRYGNYSIWDTPWGFNDWFTYQVGVLNGTADNTNPGLNPVTTTGFNSEASSLTNKAFEARVFSNPFIVSDNIWIQNLGLGLGASAQTVNNERLLPAIVSPGLNPIFTYQTNVYANGPRARLHPQMYWYAGRFAVVADYTQTVQNLTPTSASSANDIPRVAQLNNATEVNLICNLTSEVFQYKKMIPERDFKPLEKGATGAWQFVFRWSNLNMDNSVFQDYVIEDKQKIYTYADPRLSIQKANVWSVTLNWYWNEFIRVATEYDHTAFEGGCSTGGLNAPINPGCLTAGAYATASSSQVLNRPIEHLFMQRFQLLF